MSALAQAFQAAVYRIETADGTFDLQVNEVHPGFRAYIAAQRITQWAVITAYNPGGRQQPERENQAANARLHARIVGQGWTFCTARSIDRSGAWPEEPGFCVFGVPADVLIALGHEFAQAAVLVGGLDAKPRLLWMPER